MAIFFREEEAEKLDQQLSLATERYISPLNLWETRIQIYARAGQSGERALIAWFESAEIKVVPITSSHTTLAIEARKKYGGRPARLNMGDCFAYALAKEMDAVLLFKGNDFRLTDVKRLD